ncbi:hypothetical protein RRF57_004222 [Xylaria bambusicola]|uniref:Uncharacterized protein n=1 Tax=Xylaria bambusicola TaxID=326684 RepID=A0AAN7Z483_9PEZI
MSPGGCDQDSLVWRPAWRMRSVVDDDDEGDEDIEDGLCRWIRQMRLGRAWLLRLERVKEAGWLAGWRV